MKKILISVLSLSLLIGGLFFPNNAAAAENDTERIITPMFTYVNSFNNVFNIFDDGEACIDSTLSYRNADEARIVVYLEKYVSGNWILVKSWTADEYGGLTYCTGSYYVTAGAQYRMRSFGYVFVGSQLVENVSYTSSPQYY